MSVIPLQHCARDLATIIQHVLLPPWNTEMVNRSLQCYQSWANHAFEDGVKVETAFPELAQVVMYNTTAFFQDRGTIFTAAEVYNELADLNVVPRSTLLLLADVIASNDIVQNYYANYKEDMIDITSFRSLAALTINIFEGTSEEIWTTNHDMGAALLDIMEFLLDSDFSDLTFTFWIDVCEGHLFRHADPWIRRIPLLLLARCKYNENNDQDEWRRYREDVTELFEAICQHLGSEIMEPIVMQYLIGAVETQESTEVLLVLPVTEVR